MSGDPGVPWQQSWSEAAIREALDLPPASGAEARSFSSISTDSRAIAAGTGIPRKWVGAHHSAGFISDSSVGISSDTVG